MFGCLKWVVALCLLVLPCAAQSLPVQTHLLLSDEARKIQVNYASLQEQHQGLPAGKFIYQTSDHTMWLGTYNDGVISWDGTHFTHYKQRRGDSSGLPANEIFWMGEQDPHHLWIGTRQGLVLLDRIKQKCIPFYSTTGARLNDATVLTAANGKTYVSSSLLFGELDMEKHVVKPLGMQGILIPGKPDKYRTTPLLYMHGLFQDKNRTLWSTVEQKDYAGLCHFDTLKKCWVLHPVEGINLKQEGIDKRYLPTKITFWTMLPDADGDRVWLGGWASGLWCYRISSGRYESHALFRKPGEQPDWINTIQCILPKGKHELYVGTYHCIEVVDTRAWTVQNISPNANENGCGALFRDHCSNVWFSGNSVTFGRISPYNNRFQPYGKLDIAQPNILGVYDAPDSSLWVTQFLQPGNGTNTNFIYHYRNYKLVARYTFPENPPSGTLGGINKVQELADGNIYAFGGRGRMYKADTVLHQFFNVPIRYTGNPANYKDFAGDFIHGYDFPVFWNDSVLYANQQLDRGEGMARVNTSARTAVSYSTRGGYGIRDCYSRLVSASHTVGVTVFYPETEKAEQYNYNANDPDSPPTDEVRRVYQAADSTYYFTSASGFFCGRMEPGTQPRFRLLIPDLGCGSMIPGGKDELWISTDAGQLLLNLKTFSWRLFTGRDGYHWGRRFSLANGHWLMNDGSLINPGSIIKNIFRPRPVSAGLSVFEVPYVSDTFSALKKVFHLRHDQNFFSIAYSSDGYIDEASNKYAYKLEGYDQEWVQAGARTTAYYTGVAPGRYNFWVKAANSDGLWGRPLQLHTIIIIPAWYQTIWFHVLVAIAAIAILAIIFWLRLKEVKSKAREKQTSLELLETKARFEQQIAETEMAALRAQMNPHFIFNVLNSINKYILTSDPDSASDYLNSFSRLIRLVLENSKSMKVPLATDLEALELYIRMEQLRFSNKFSYTLSYPPGLDMQYLQVPPLLIQPYVENAIWHGLMQKESGERILNIRLSQPEEDLLKIVVSDNGIGRERASQLRSKSATQHKSFGLQITKDRIAIVNKLYNIKTTVEINDLTNDADGSPAGTEVSIVIPV